MPESTTVEPVKNTCFVQNRSQLAEMLGTSRQLVAYHLKNRPGNPGARPDGRYDVLAWRDYFRQCGTIGDAGQTGRGAARERMEALQAEKLAFQISVLKKDFIPKAVVKRVNAQFINAAKTRSFAGVNRLVTLIRLAPDTQAACDVMRSEQLDIWRTMEKGEWFTPEPDHIPAKIENQAAEPLFQI